MRFLCSLLPLLLFCTCQSGTTSPGSAAEVYTIDSRDFQLLDMDGTAARRVERYDVAGALVEDGYVRDSLRVGTWTVYDPVTKVPKQVTGYVDGTRNGPFFEFDEQGRLTTVANYRNGKLEGHYGKYRSGRPELTASYRNGELDGMMVTYDIRKNKPKQEVNYKMGKKDGPLRYFNEQGEIVMEYLYRDDEKVSGGMVE